MLFLLSILNLSSPYSDAPRVAVYWQGEPAWYESLIGSLGDRGLALFELPPQVSDRLEWGRRNQIDLLVILRAQPSNNRVTVSYQLVEVISGKILTEGNWNSELPSRRALVSAFWIPLLEALDKNIQNLSGAGVIVKAKPGTLIKGLGSDDVSINEEGLATINIRVPGIYRFKAIHPNYRPKTGVFAALKNGLELNIEQEPNRRFSLNAGASLFAFPNIEARYHFLSDRFWIGLGLDQYIFGLFLGGDNSSPNQNSVIVDLGLLIPFLSFGYYLDDSSSFLRFFTQLDFGTRILSKFLALDPLGSFQIGLGLGFEWNFWSSLNFSILIKTLYITPASNPDVTQLINTKNMLPTFTTTFGTIQFPFFYGGVTWSF